MGDITGYQYQLLGQALHNSSRYPNNKVKSKLKIIICKLCPLLILGVR